MASIPWQKLALAALSRLNSDVVRSLVEKAATGNLPSTPEDFSSRIQEVWGTFAEKTTKDCKGKVTSDLVFELV
jgi:hypothetical protein